MDVEWVYLCIPHAPLFIEYEWFEISVLAPMTKIRPFKYIENFTTKNWKFSDKNSDIFYISAQNTDSGYSLPTIYVFGRK